MSLKKIRERIEDIYYFFWIFLLLSACFFVRIWVELKRPNIKKIRGTTVNGEP